MALQGSDLLIVQRNQQSYKMPASEIASFVPPAPNVGNGTITIVQPGTTNQTFTVNQSGPTTITLKNDNTNTTYSAGNGLSLSGTTFSAKAGDNTITVDSAGIKVNTGNLGIPGSVGVTSITPGEGLRNGSSTGSTNSTAVTSTGTFSVDNTVVRTSGNQTISGTKIFNDSVQTSYQSMSGTWNLNESNNWEVGSISIPTPSNLKAGTGGLLLCTSAPNWPSAGTNPFKYANGEPPDITDFPAIVPYFVKSASEILIGVPTVNIT